MIYFIIIVVGTVLLALTMRYLEQRAVRRAIRHAITNHKILDLTAKLKASADALRAAVENNQPKRKR